MEASSSGLEKKATNKKNDPLYVQNAQTYMEEAMAKLGLTPEVYDRFYTVATRYFNSHVKLVSTKGLSESQLGQIIADSPSGQLRGLQGQTFVGFFCDPKLSGETVTAPHVRTPVLNVDQMTTLLGSATQGRAPSGGAGHIQAGDLFFFPDAGKHGDRSTKSLRAWVSIPKKTGWRWVA